MQQAQQAIMVFHSTQGALSTEQFFKENNLIYEMIPTPREITASCGLSIRFLEQDIALVAPYLESEKSQVKGIFQSKQINGRRVMCQMR